MWFGKNIILLNLLTLLVASPTPPQPSKNCPVKCICEAGGAIVRCPGKTSLKDWQRIGTTISKNAIQLEIAFVDFPYLMLSCFKKMPKLTLLRILGGKMKAFPAGLPKLFPALTFLTIRGTEINCLPKTVFDDLQQLVNLNLGANKITRLSKHNFKGLDNLKVLNLERNQINCIDKDSFVGLRNLLLVSLDSNKLTKLPTGLFDQISRQVILIFSNNKIQKIQSGLFKPFLKISLLDLRGNEIAEIDDNAFEGLKPVSGSLGINLSNNPIVCNAKSSFSFSNGKFPEFLIFATCPPKPRTVLHLAQ